jgi:hypothetical protein
MAAAFKLRAPIPTEGDECQWLLEWAAVTKYDGRRLADLLIMIPNGTKLFGDPKHRAIQMARMKSQGFKVGVFDYLLPVAIVPFHGLWLEMKRTQGGVVSATQMKFEALMRSLGWATLICAGWEQASRAILSYLGRTP